MIWDFTGFFPPIANLPALNSVKAGSAVPIKFSLGRQPGTGRSWPTARRPRRRSTARPLAPTGPAQAITIAEALSYRSDTDTYSLTWKTTKGWTGCRLLTVELDDGTVHEAAFRFTK